MSAILIESEHLLNGQSAPFTGAWQSVGNGRDLLFTTFATVSGSAVSLEYRSPIWQDQGVPFYTINVATSGYASPAFTTSPMGQVRAICSGSGNFWCSVTAQN